MSYLETCVLRQIPLCMQSSFKSFPKKHATNQTQKKPIFATARSELSIVTEKVFFWDSYCRFPSETPFKLLHRIPWSQEHLPKVHEWMLFSSIYVCIRSSIYSGIGMHSGCMAYKMPSPSGTSRPRD